jgi:hypothetical protein
VQKADSTSLFDDLDAALQSGSSEKRVAMLRQVTDLFQSEGNRLNECCRQRRLKSSSLS